MRFEWILLYYDRLWLLFNSIRYFVWNGAGFGMELCVGVNKRAPVSKKSKWLPSQRVTLFRFFFLFLFSFVFSRSHLAWPMLWLERPILNHCSKANQGNSLNSEQWQPCAIFIRRKAPKSTASPRKKSLGWVWVFVD